MKFTAVFFFTLLISSLFSQTDCDCWSRVFAEQGKSFEASFESLENNFFYFGYLNGRKASDYWELASQIERRNEYFILGLKTEFLFFTKHDECFVQNTCESDVYKKIRKMNDLLMSYPNISPEQTFADFKEVFDKKDLNLTEVKLYLLTFYVAPYFNYDAQLTRKVPENFNPTPTYNFGLPEGSRRNVLHVQLKGGDTLFINDVHVDIENVKDIALRHILDTSDYDTIPKPIYTLKFIEGMGKRKVSNQFISLQNKKSTSYNAYISVQNELVEAFHEGRNIISIKEYGISYDEMKKEPDKYEVEIKAVRTQLPQRISEAEPVD